MTDYYRSKYKEKAFITGQSFKPSKSLNYFKPSGAMIFLQVYTNEETKYDEKLFI